MSISLDRDFFPVKGAPCRSCLNSREKWTDDKRHLISLTCIQGIGSHRSYKEYGERSQADGESVCSYYLHDDEAWW